MEKTTETTETTITETTEPVAVPVVPVTVSDPDAASITGSAAADSAIAEKAAQTATAGKVTTHREQEK